MMMACYDLGSPRSEILKTKKKKGKGKAKERNVESLKDEEIRQIGNCERKYARAFWDYAEISWKVEEGFASARDILERRESKWCSGRILDKTGGKCAYFLLRAEIHGDRLMMVTIRANPSAEQLSLLSTHSSAACILVKLLCWEISHSSDYRTSRTLSTRNSVVIVLRHNCSNHKVAFSPDPKTLDSFQCNVSITQI